MNPQSLTRQFYDKVPYPPPGVQRMRWRLPALEWMLAIDREDRSAPARALVAGCGSGSEAFLLQRALKNTEVVAVDFSAESIRVARKTQATQAGSKKIRFLEADLSDPGFPGQVGTSFDLILCHGVLTYIPQPESVLRNLAQCLSPDGVFYLGVNGATHFSAHLRPVLSKLGFDLLALPRDLRWRKLLQMWEDVDGGAGLGRLGHLPTSYFGGDFFGGLFHNFSLQEWVDKFSPAGLFLRADLSAHRAARPMVGSGAASLFMERPRAEVCQLLDVMHPLGFHRLLLAKQKPPNPPWTKRRQLAAWRPKQTGLFRASFPKKARKPGTWQEVQLKSRALQTQFDWPLPAWGLETFRHADGSKALRELMREAGGSAVTAQFAEQMFLMHQFGVLNFFPP